MYLYSYSGPTPTLKKKKSRIAWTKEEKDEIFKHLGGFIQKKIEYQENVNVTTV